MIKTEAYSDSLQFLSLTKKNGYKAGTLYSMKPTDGAGDFVWGRALDSYRLNSSGVLELVASGVPRIDYTNTCPELLIEGARTNIDKQSQNLGNATWTKTTTTVSSTEVAPDGTSTAYSMSDTSAVAFQYFAQTVTYTTSSVYTRSYYIKKSASALTYWSGIDIVSGANYVRCIFNNYTGTYVTATGGTAVLVGVKVYDINGYYRVCITYQFVSGTSSTYYVYPALSSNGTSTSAAATGANTFWGFQNELGYNATSYIPTTTASVTRPADIGYNTTINWSSLKGTIFVRARIYESVSAKVDTLFSINDDDSLENYLTCSTSMTRDIYIETLGGASNVNNYDYPLDTDGIYSIAIGYDFSGANNLLNIAINGELKLPSATQTNGGPEILERLDLGSLKGTLTQVDNRIIGLMYFEDMLIDDDIVNITA